MAKKSGGRNVYRNATTGRFVTESEAKQAQPQLFARAEAKV